MKRKYKYIVVGGKEFDLKYYIWEDCTIEFHLYNMDEDIDFSEGVKIYDNRERLLNDYSDYIYKYNVITDIPDGFIVTNDPDKKERKDNPVIINIKNLSDRLADNDIQNNPIELSLNERVSDLETALCELSEKLEVING